MNKTIVGIVSVLIIGGLLFILFTRPFKFQNPPCVDRQGEVDSLKSVIIEKEYERATAMLNWKDCEESLTVHHANAIPDTGSKSRIRALEYLASVLREQNDSLKSIKMDDLVSKLQPSLFSDGINAFLYEDSYVKFGLHAYGINRPLERTTDVQYNLDSYELKQKQIVYQERQVPVYVSSAYVFAEAGTDLRWSLIQFRPYLSLGLNADLGKVFTVEATLMRMQYVPKEVEFTSGIGLRYKFGGGK